MDNFVKSKWKNLRGCRSSFRYTAVVARYGATCYPESAPLKGFRLNSTARKFGAAFGLASIAAFSVALPASAAADTVEYGVWAVGDGNDYTVSFSDSSMPNALVNMDGDWDTYDIYAPTDDDEGFTADTPVGAILGDNTTSGDYLYLKASTVDNDGLPLFIDIEFAEAVPADQLILAISDIDSDHARISMIDGFGNSIPAESIIGSATTLGFNWADMSNTTDVPTVTATDDYEVTMGDAPDDTDGSTGWVRPSAPVKSLTITINTEDGNVSSERIWLGQVVAGSDDSLAGTGSSDSLYLVAAAGGAMLAIGGLVGLRRRQA